MARRGAAWRVRWRNAIIQLSEADAFYAHLRRDAESCGRFRERCEPLSQTRVDTLSFQSWERTIAPNNAIYEFGGPSLHYNLYERVGQRCQRSLELPDNPERWKLVDGTLIIVTHRGALAVTHEGVVEPVECL